MLITPDAELSHFHGFTKAKAWLIGLTGLLVLLPALINSGVDIYKAALNIPKTHAESINAELFQAHFQEDPITVVPVSIQTEAGGLTMQVSIYQNGDVYAEYGFHSQWFPMPQPKQLTTNFHDVPSIFSMALAQVPYVQENKKHLPYVQQDQMKGNQIKRTRIYKDGQVITFEINAATGEISNRQVQKNDVTPSSGDAGLNKIQKGAVHKPQKPIVVDLAND